MISMWRADNDDLPYCVICKDYVHDKRNYVINNEEETVIEICEACFNKLIDLKNEVDNIEDYEEIYK